MVRRVHFRKAVAGGFLGALAWESVARLLVFLGVPVFDLSWMLGSMVTRGYSWWPLGFALHASIGIIWAVFYAYFFWSDLRTHRIYQGMIFSIIPMLLAGLIMIPNLIEMREYEKYHHATAVGLFCLRFGLSILTTNLIGHLLYGAVLGFWYHSPVGSSIERERELARSLAMAGTAK